MNSDLYCLHIVLSSVSTLLILFSTIFHHESLRSEQMSPPSDFEEEQSSHYYLQILFSLASLEKVSFLISFVTLEAHLGWGVSIVNDPGRIQMSGLSIKFLPPFPWLSHLRDWKSKEGSYSALTLSDMFGAPHLLSNGPCTQFVKRGWDPLVTTSRNVACAELKENQQSS